MRPLILEQSNSTQAPYIALRCLREGKCAFIWHGIFALTFGGYYLYEDSGGFLVLTDDIYNLAFLWDCNISQVGGALLKCLKLKRAEILGRLNDVGNTEEIKTLSWEDPAEKSLVQETPGSTQEDQEAEKASSRLVGTVLGCCCAYCEYLRR
jgi:hypothetical protein